MSTEETEETVSEETTSEETTSEETTSEETASEETEETTETAGTYIYVGPSMPNGRLANNTLLRGTKTEVLAYAAERAKGFDVSGLVIPTSDLAAARYAIRNQTGSIWALYSRVKKQVDAAKKK